MHQPRAVEPVDGVHGLHAQDAKLLEVGQIRRAPHIRRGCHRRLCVCCAAHLINRIRKVVPNPCAERTDGPCRSFPGKAAVLKLLLGNRLEGLLRLRVLGQPTLPCGGERPECLAPAALQRYVRDQGFRGAERLKGAAHLGGGIGAPCWIISGGEARALKGVALLVPRCALRLVAKAARRPKPLQLLVQVIESNGAHRLSTGLHQPGVSQRFLCLAREAIISRTGRAILRGLDQEGAAAISRSGRRDKPCRRRRRRQHRNRSKSLSGQLEGLRPPLWLELHGCCAHLCGIGDFFRLQVEGASTTGVGMLRAVIDPHHTWNRKWRRRRRRKHPDQRQPAAVDDASFRKAGILRHVSNDLGVQQQAHLVGRHVSGLGHMGDQNRNHPRLPRVHSRQKGAAPGGDDLDGDRISRLDSADWLRRRGHRGCPHEGHHFFVGCNAAIGPELD
mmetsp:Transcript_96877/g.289378  ORF Transcript_96877/g.289378 Transcript_96877/m.289378 type:complete len:446 (-) Transcript_96877:9-1346(-)